MFAGYDTPRHPPRLPCAAILIPIPKHLHLHSIAVRAVLVVFALVTAILISDLLFQPEWTITTITTTTFRTRPIIVALATGEGYEEPLSSSSSSSLRQLCDATEWTPGLWLSCHSHCGANEEALCGGLNNARCRLATCVRLAIDAGAGLVVPTFQTRSETTLGPHDGRDEVCADDFWDVARLRERLRAACPQLEMRACGNTTGLGRKIESGGVRHYNDAGHARRGSFRERVVADLAAHNVTAVSPERPVRVDFWDSMFAWNYTAALEAHTVRKDLFRALAYNADILRLGAEIFALAARYAPFVGVHFRGERDWPPFYGDADKQMELYAEDLVRLRNSTAGEDLSNVYISCGDREAIERFRRKLEPLQFTVHDKWTLLADHPVLNAKMENLTFDQKGIVEYTTLTSADYFLGVGPSSMSLLIAYARTIDEENEYFDEYINPNSTHTPPYNRDYVGSPVMKGNKETRLLMVSGPDIMDRFP